MSNPTPNSGDIFDMRKIRKLVELMNEHDLSEIDLCQGETRIRLRRQREAVAPAGNCTVTPSLAPPPVPTGAASPATPADDPQVAIVTSPMVGTFYAAASPDTPAFIKVGDHVGPDTTVCIVEAMKVFNEIPAGVSGKVIAVLVENGEPVEYGQPLFKVDSRT